MQGGKPGTHTLRVRSHIFFTCGVQIEGRYARSLGLIHVVRAGPTSVDGKCGGKFMQLRPHAPGLVL